ncbi:hypothetical protein H4K35_05485 [Myroides sp. NP-2]|uniref:leucine-rich repeat domain-containing protein n=1 Tax=Myroides sp. NP-2 TaxID=2759945 RepID=UPI0015F837FC|nr:hypothetical protein [Myroides sp. NP-2]MBB1149589.1 hypothetical protein [Myroides sp. NP-2]
MDGVVAGKTQVKEQDERVLRPRPKTRVNAMKKHTYTYTPSCKALVVFSKPTVDLYQEPYLNEIEDLSIDNAAAFQVDLTKFPRVKRLTIATKEPYTLDDLAHLQQLEEINTNCSLPESVTELSQLKTIKLSDQALLHAPVTLKDAAVTSLSLYYAPEGELPIPMPDFVYQMTQLEELDLTLCNFSELSEEINRLTQLKVLKIRCSMTYLSDFPSLSGLLNLRHLEINGETVQGQLRPKFALFSKVLEQVCQLSELETLDISSWYPKNQKERIAFEGKKNSLPDIFDRFHKLKKLTIAWMKLDYLPPSIFQLHSLEELNIVANYLAEEELDHLQRQLPQLKIVGRGHNKSRF